MAWVFLCCWGFLLDNGRFCWMGGVFRRNVGKIGGLGEFAQVSSDRA